MGIFHFAWHKPLQPQSHLVEHSVSADLLFDFLMLDLSQSERDRLSTALQEVVVSDDAEELLDLMGGMEVRTVPTQDNLRAMLIQVARDPAPKICP